MSADEVARVSDPCSYAKTRVGTPCHVWPALLLSILVSALCYIAAGPTLGLFFGTFLLVTLIVPVLQSGDATLRGAANIAIGTCAGAGIVWVCAATQPDVYLSDCAKSLLVLGAYVLALLGIGAMLLRIGLAPVAVHTTTIVLGLAWLSWPVWLSPALESAHGQAIVDVLVPAHPLFCVNGVMKQFGAWDHYPGLAYPTLTVLNQDVAYRLPTSIVPAVVLQGIGGLVMLFFCARWTDRRSPSGPRHVRGHMADESATPGGVKAHGR